MVPFLDTVIVRFDSKILLMESTLSNFTLVLLYSDEYMVDLLLNSANSILFPPVPMYSSELQIKLVPLIEQFSVKESPIHLRYNLVSMAQVVPKHIVTIAAAVRKKTGT